MNGLLDVLPRLQLHDGELPEELKISTFGRYATYYAPFESINTEAKIVLCGITPGISQACLALSTAKQLMKEGRDREDVLKGAKATASFAGAMRKNLAAMMDYIGLQQYLGISSTKELFAQHSNLVHYTSALRNPIVRDGKNYSGGSAMVNEPYLWDQIDSVLAAELESLPPNTIVIPLGGSVESVFKQLGDKRNFDMSRVLLGLPHPSGANAERISYFCENKQREHLSKKTNPDKIETRRHSLIAQVSDLIEQNNAEHHA